MGSERDISNGPTRPASPLWQRLRLPVAILIIAACAGTILALVFDARARFTRIDYGLAASVEGELARLGTDIGRLTAQLASEGPEADLTQVRRNLAEIERQMDRASSALAAAELLWEPPYAAALAVLHGKIEATTILAVSPEPELQAALASLTAALPELLGMATDLADRARRDHQTQNDLTRSLIGDSLLRMVVLTVILVLALSAGAVQLMRLYLRSREQADAARRARARLEAIFRISADAILVTDWTGRVLDFNRAALAIFGHPSERLAGADAMALLFPDELREAQRQQVTQALQTSDPRTDGPLRLELEAVAADGSRFPVEVSLAAARVEGGDIIVALMRDISARRRAERELTEARDKALAGEQAKADFLAMMSHEMRTPLNGLTGSIELLAQTGLDPHQRELVSVLGASADILLDHVNSVLDIARSEARPTEAELVDFDFDRLVEECIANQAGLVAAGGNRLDSRALSGAVGALRGEPARLRQILLNLLGNAVKFTRNGRITVETEILGPWLEIRVIDTGIGIAPADQERIFEDFVTLDAGYDRRAGGTGLGLGIARRLARIMGGDIGVVSTPGQGSRFTLRLPLRRGTPGAAWAPPGPAEPRAPHRPLSVLLIEDNDINRFIAQNFLESAGHEVVAARSGLEGLASADFRHFDVVLTDISMPGLDGLEVARRIRSGGGPSAGSRILALTAHSLAAEPDALARAGMDGCLQKPIGRAALLAALEPPETAPPPAEPKEPLRELESQIGPSALAALIRQMILDGDAIMARLAALGPQPPPEAARRLVHQMAGAVSTFGSGPLYRHLSELLEALRTGRPAAGLLAALPALWQETRGALAEERQTLAPPEAPGARARGA